MKKSVMLSLLLHGSAVAVGAVGWSVQTRSAPDRLPFQVSLSSAPSPIVPRQPHPHEPLEPQPEELPIEAEFVQEVPAEFERVSAQQAPLLAMAPAVISSKRLSRPLPIRKAGEDGEGGQVDGHTS